MDVSLPVLTTEVPSSVKWLGDVTVTAPVARSMETVPICGPWVSTSSQLRRAHSLCTKVFLVDDQSL